MRHGPTKDLAEALFADDDGSDDKLYDGVDLDTDEVQDAPKILTNRTAVLGRKD